MIVQALTACGIMESLNKESNMAQIVDVVDNDFGLFLLEEVFLAQAHIVAAREGWEVVRLDDENDGFDDVPILWVTRPEAVAAHKRQRESLDRARDFWQYGGIDAEVNE